MTPTVWKKCKIFIPEFFSKPQYVKSMVCIRIFFIKKRFFEQDISKRGLVG